MGYRECSPREFGESAFRVIGEDWLLVGAGAPEKPNAMTASWGGFGVLLGKPVVTLYLRPERYTHALIDESGRFSVTVLPEAYRAVYRTCGSLSGREHDKIKETGLTPLWEDGVPYFEEGRAAAICRVLYRAPLLYEGFPEPEAAAEILKKGSLHTLFIGEILRFYEKE